MKYANLTFAVAFSIVEKRLSLLVDGEKAIILKTQVAPSALDVF